MSSIKQTVDSYYNAWRFIENYLPNYSKRDDVLEDDILLRFIEGDDLSKDDMKWIDSEFHGDKKMISDELVRLETGFMEEALRVYYNIKLDRPYDHAKAKQYPIIGESTKEQTLGGCEP